LEHDLKKSLIAPSILSADFARLHEEIKAIETAGADWVHVDVMDGHFVDNLTIGPPVVAAIRKVTKLPLDVHLMIDRPEKSVEQFIKAGSDRITIHVESTPNCRSVIETIRNAQKSPGITLRPQTPLSAIEPFLSSVDLVLVMTVTPGWGGQSFMHDQLEKIKTLKTWAEKNNPKLFIEVDGGINSETAKLCYNAGARVFVAGHAVFRSGDYKKAIQDLRS